MAPSLAPRLCWMDGRATFTMKKSRTNMNVPNISTIRADQERPDGAWTELGRTRVAVMLPSLLPPLRGESSRLEDGPGDLRAVPGQVGFGERDQVILADGPVHADRPFGDHGAEPAVGLVEIAERSGMEHHRRLHPGDGQRPDPPIRPGRLGYGYERGQFARLQPEEAGRDQPPARTRGGQPRGADQAVDLLDPPAPQAQD